MVRLDPRDLAEAWSETISLLVFLPKLCGVWWISFNRYVLVTKLTWLWFLRDQTRPRLVQIQQAPLWSSPVSNLKWTVSFIVMLFRVWCVKLSYSAHCAMQYIGFGRMLCSFLHSCAPFYNLKWRALFQNVLCSNFLNSKKLVLTCCFGAEHSAKVENRRKHGKNRGGLEQHPLDELIGWTLIPTPQNLKSGIVLPWTWPHLATSYNSPTSVATIEQLRPLWNTWNFVY